jgi:hypothetical protein
MAIGCQDKEQVQENLFLLQRGQETVDEETVRDEAEPSVNTPDALGIEDSFLYHG